MRKVEKINCQTTQTVTQQQFKQDDSLFLKGFGSEDAHWRMLAALWSSLKLSLSLFNVTAWSSNTYSKTTREFSCKQEEGKEKKTVKKSEETETTAHTKKKTKSCSACTSKPGSAGHTAGKTPEEEKKPPKKRSLKTWTRGWRRPGCPVGVCVSKCVYVCVCVCWPVWKRLQAVPDVRVLRSDQRSSMK